MSFGRFTETIREVAAADERFFGTAGEFNGGEVITGFPIYLLTTINNLPMRDPDSTYEIELRINGSAFLRTLYTSTFTYNHVEDATTYTAYNFFDVSPLPPGVPSLFQGYVIPETGEISLSYLFGVMPTGTMEMVYQGIPFSIWDPEASDPGTAFAAQSTGATAKCDWDLAEDVPTGRDYRIMGLQEQCISDYDAAHGKKINEMASGTDWD